jgi:hypothetical protein
MKSSRLRITIALIVLTASLLCASVVFVDAPALAQKAGRRPILILTKNGEVVVKIVGPKGATDVHILWGGPGVPEGGGCGYWTKNHQEIPKTRFTFGSDINDIHFSTTGRVPRVPPIPAPPEANDVEIGWEEDGRISEAWWTRDGQQLAAIPVTGNAGELSVQFAPQSGRNSEGGAKTTSTSTPTPTPTPNPTPQNVGNQVGYHVGTNTANGLFVTTFDTPQGKIRVNLPDDMAAGDTISGTVETEPQGKNDAERAQNEGVLNGEVIELEGQKTKVGDKTFKRIIPITLTPEAKTIVLVHNGQTVATTEIPISATPPPTPMQFTLPTGGQQGRPIEIKGACNGIFSPQDSVKIGGTTAPPLAESPRKIVVQNTSNTVGPTTIECNENGSTTESPFRNIGIKLSAPKLNLRRGETTTLHVQVMGLDGITQAVPLELVNNSPNIINMAGGVSQRTTIEPPAVQPGGTYAIDRTLTGITTGNFNITGTVTWAGTFSKIFCPDKCKPAGPVGASTTDVSITPQGFQPGEIDKMAAGVSVINNVPMPAAGKPIQAATTALLTGAFGAAETLAKKNGVTIWVRVSCKVCELENCLSIQRLNVHDHHSGWEKVMDLVQVNKNGGATMDQNYDAAGIAAEIAAKAATLKCP